MVKDWEVMQFREYSFLDNSRATKLVDSVLTVQICQVCVGCVSNFCKGKSRYYPGDDRFAGGRIMCQVCSGLWLVFGWVRHGWGEEHPRG